MERRNDDIRLADAAEIRECWLQWQVGSPPGRSAYLLSFPSPGAMSTKTQRQLPESCCERVGGVGGLQLLSGDGGIPAPDAAAGIADTAWLDRALAPHSYPVGPAGRLWRLFMGILGSWATITSGIGGSLRFYLFTGPNFFIVTFALVAVWFYTGLAKRRLSSSLW